MLIDRSRRSPNFDTRDGRVVDMIILHYTGMADAESAIDLLCRKGSGVSSHYVVREDGYVHELVGEQDRAWHAGVASWFGDTAINARSIGIEIVNGGHDFGLPHYPDDQIDGVIQLIHDIRSRHEIPLDLVIGHSDVAPGRKNDPGEHFPWGRLEAAGALARPPLPQILLHGGDGWQWGQDGADVLEARKALRKLGYGIATEGPIDQTFADVMRALRARYGLGGAIDIA
ncbi:MAG: N-acetylmuramoyl-L-alanine amidase [Pseudomonadota bacterium]